MILLPIILWWAKSPMRFSVGRSRQLICLLSLWAVATAALPMTRNVIASEPVSPPPSQSESAVEQLIREGTAIPPTEGRVVMLGRRWAFIPDESTLLYKQLMGKKPMDISSVKRRWQPRPNRIVSNAKLLQPTGRVQVTTSQTTGARRLMSPVTLVSSPNQLVSSKSGFNQSDGKVEQSSSADRLVLAENLMLQRIVGSIRSDVSDDRWILTGTINEFFGENRMVIATAQRGIVE